MFVQSDLTCAGAKKAQKLMESYLPTSPDHGSKYTFCFLYLTMISQYLLTTFGVLDTCGRVFWPCVYSHSSTRDRCGGFAFVGIGLVVLDGSPTKTPSKKSANRR